MFEKLFSPYSIGNCEMSNRLVVTAMVVNYCNHDGTLTEKYMAYHEEKAKGGWGLIVTEDYAISEQAKGYDRIAGLWNDDQIEKNIEFTNRIHKYDSKVFCQIYHAGRQSHSGVNGGVQPVAPSAIPCAWKREIPKELSISEIEQIVEDFGDCALRAKKSGFDGVEIHAGHGYLLAEFLSTYANKRVDKYGGCLENRARIVKDVIANIRSKVGQEFPVTIRFSADERVPGGRTIAESRALAKWFEQWGVDAIHVSTGVYGSYDQSIVSNMYMEKAAVVEFSAEIKKLVDIPIIVVNRINNPEMAETILELDKADFIGIGRGSLADPHLPNKAKNGEVESIRYCIGCLQGCIFKQEGPDGSKCLVNPTLGKEYYLDYSKVEEPKKVLIIGGGPGGMEAARAAAMRGHQVKLIEKQNFLGGQFKSAAYPPSKGDLATYTAWIIQELEKYEVEVLLGTLATEEMIRQENADEIIVATGGSPITPPIKGIEKPIVHKAEEVLLGHVQPGNCIVVAGGGEVGGETALHLAVQERDVSVVEMKNSLFEELDGIATIQLLNLMDKYGVKQYTETRVVEIEDDGVIVSNGAETVKLPADMVVLGLGYVPNNKLAEKIKDIYPSAKVIGGAAQTSNALVAIEEGFMAGMSV